MNQQGKDFITKINNDFSKLPSKVKSRYQNPTDSKITERVMRLGQEAKIYELETPGLYNYTITQDLEDIARATLKEDFINLQLGE